MAQSSSLETSDNRGHFSFTTMKGWNDEDTRLQLENRTLIQPSSGQKNPEEMNCMGVLTRALRRVWHNSEKHFNSHESMILEKTETIVK